MAATKCDYCTTRRADSPVQGLCTKCYDYSGWENQHQDDAHDIEGNEDPNCPICQGVPDPADVPIVKGHSNGIKKSHTSHAGCNHEKSKAARAKCRKERAAQ